MTQQDENHWSYLLPYNVKQFAGKILEYKPLVGDQTWSIGSNYMTVLAEDQTSVNIYPWFYSTAGQYAVLPQQFYSPQLNNYRQIVIYTPPSYYENTLKIQTNVLIMHDGQNLFNASTSFAGVAWDCQTTINDLVNEGKIDEVFIIGVYNTPDRINEYTYSFANDCGCPGPAGGQGDLYLDFLIEQVVPAIAQQFRIAVETENLGIVGSSLGGLSSCYAGWTRPSVWSKIGCMSSSFWWNNEDFNNLILNSSTPQYPVEIYLDDGTAGEGHDDYLQTLEVKNHMEKLGYVIEKDLFYFVQIGGAHNEYWWGKRFHEPMTDFYFPRLIPSSPVPPKKK
jgi:predicted alpha/beta superfamily hydrolase